MQLSDIAKVRVDWMEQFANEPQLHITLKRDKRLIPWDQFRFRKYGELYFACQENEVRFVQHSPKNHEGFGGSKYVMQMEHPLVAAVANTLQARAPGPWPDCTSRRGACG